jgi:hypothetical protein
VTLTSVSANGATNGIVINNTTGSFTVTGDGANADSGGVIQNTAGDNIDNTVGDGIALTNTRNVNLNWMRIEDAGDHGIHINNVTNFQLKNSVLNDDHAHTVADDDEQGILINGLFGQSLIQDVAFTAINEDGIEVITSTADDATTDELTLRRVTFSDHQGANGEHGIDYRPTGTSDTRLLIDDSDFNIDGDGSIGALLNATGTSNAEIIVRASTFNGATAFGSGGVEARSSASGTVKYLIENNIFNDNDFFALAVLNDGNSTMDATVRFNTFNNATDFDTDTAIFVRQDENGVARVLLDNNTINSRIQLRVIDIVAQDSNDDNSATGTLDITITNNTFAEPDSLNFASGIILQNGVFGAAGHQNVLQAKIENNTGTVGGGFAGFLGFGEGIGLAERVGTTFELEQGVSASSDPVVVLGANNPGVVSDNTNSAIAFVHDTSDGGQTVAIVANGTVTQPTLPTDPALLLATAGDGTGAPSVLTQAELDAVTEAAIDRLSTAGLTASQVAILEAVEFEIIDLAAGVLGASDFFTVQMDVNAAGHGWFVDTTPQDDEEFGADLVADTTSDAYRRMDLLTVVMHELGHVLGMDHDVDDSLMGDTLESGVRRLAVIDEIFSELGGG